MTSDGELWASSSARDAFLRFGQSATSADLLAANQ